MKQMRHAVFLHELREAVGEKDAVREFRLKPDVGAGQGLRRDSNVFLLQASGRCVQFEWRGVGATVCNAFDITLFRDKTILRVAYIPEAMRPG